MKRKVGLVCLSSVVALLAGCGGDTTPDSARSTGLSGDVGAPDSVSTGSAGDVPRFLPGHVIVKFRDGVEPPAPTAMVRAGEHGARIARELPGGALLLELDAEPAAGGATRSLEETTLDVIDALRQQPDVEYAHEDLLMELFSTPNDPLYPKQWSYPAINLPKAWDLTTGSVVIAVLDTGSLAHPDLSTKWLSGYDYGDLDADPIDDFTWHHGLHVAGILGAKTNNGIGIAGVCQGCSLLAVKVQSTRGLISDPPPGTIVLSNVASAITWAAQHGARVINMSFGTLGVAPCSGYPAIQSAITLAAQSGVVLVAAAGNAGSSAANVTPASCVNVIAVAASDQNGALASYSNRGSRVDVTAPGGGTPLYGQGSSCPQDPGQTYSGTAGVFSAWAISKAGKQLQPADYCYRYLSGTSMAAPHVGGVAGLMLSRNPSLTSTQVRQILQKTAHPIACGLNQCGSGLIDAFASVQASTYDATLGCESSGGGNFYCDVTTVGGVGPFTASWQAISYAGIGSSDASQASGSCTVGKTAKVSVTLTDAIGRSVTKQSSFYCYLVAP